ncbi:MAG: methyltransferase domain-containing protein, partial [Nitrospirales bacterium]
ENYHVIALEPALGGFSVFEEIKNAVLDYYSHIDLAALRISAKDLDPRKHSEFDLIYSNNVIEHIPDLTSTFSAMNSVLSGKGLMVHACPNYVIPYETHFGIPVLKLFLDYQGVCSVRG